MQDGIYSVVFRTKQGARAVDLGSGVVVIDGERIRGGDAQMYYMGTVSNDGDNMSAKIVADTHTRYPNGGSVFGVSRVNITLSGRSDANMIVCEGRAAEAPHLQFQAVLTRLAS